VRGASPAVPDATVTRLTLTPRQAEVLNLLCQGLPSKTIGRRLDLSENTVRWHVQTVLGLLNVTSRTEAAFVARRHGLID
jgi:DNA-binding NarL/FixJ family response regulator